MLWQRVLPPGINWSIRIFIRDSRFPDWAAPGIQCDVGFLKRNLSRPNQLQATSGNISLATALFRMQYLALGSAEFPFILFSGVSMSGSINGGLVRENGCIDGAWGVPKFLRRGIFLLLVGIVGMVPVRAQTPLGDLTGVFVGAYHSCAVSAQGAAKCWGYNGSGQVGDGSTVNALVPSNVSGLGDGIVSLAAGLFHTCALTRTGGVKCWGYNGSGQVGDGSQVRRLTPVDVLGLSSGVKAIGAGRHHSCALTNAGAVKCWGHNGNGRLGDGTVIDRATPKDVAGLSSGVVAIALGDSHTCAVTNAGSVKCWGMNADGRLGDGSFVDSLVPVNVASASGMVSISAGAEHTCALTGGGAVRCWGGNSNGQLGDGSTAFRTGPTAVTGLISGVAEVAASGVHSCARLLSGGVKCWGGNSVGQLGDGTTTNRLTPVDVSGLASGVKTISAAYLHSCALMNANTVLCWGGNASGELGNGNTANYSTPQAVINAVPPPIVGGVSTPLAPPATSQSSYTVSDGKLPVAAVSVLANGTLGSGTITATLDLGSVLAGARANVFSAGYNVYVGALIPGRQLGSESNPWFLLSKVGGWKALGQPLTIYLENVAVGSANQKITIEVVRDTDLSGMIGGEIYIGYGLSDQEMLSSKRYLGIYKIQQ